MENLAFYLFAFMAVAGGVLLVALRNPVSSAIAMVLSFVGLAGLFIVLNADFVGFVLILFYARASMVLFILIILLRDLNDEKPVKFKSSSVVAGLVIPLLLVVQILGVIQLGSEGKKIEFEEITNDSMRKSAIQFSQADEDNVAFPREEQSAIYKSLTHEKSPKLPDTNLIGHTIFKSYNYPLQVVGVLLLVATIGVVILSKRSNKQVPTDS